MKRLDELGENSASLNAAAPELYAMLREAVVEECGPCPACERGECTMEEVGACFVQRWRAALAKASGEEVNHE